MKNKFALLLTTLAIAGASSLVAGPSDSAAFALRAAMERNAAPATTNSGEVKYVTTTNTKGGTSIVQVRDDDATSIALTKSSKGSSCSSCSSGACQAKR